MRTLSLVSIALAALLTSCERAPRSTTAPEQGSATPEQIHDTVSVMEPNACAFVGTPMNATQCECVGGTARADLGDGHASCQEGENELARISYGVEHGVCCQPIVPVAVQPLAPGQRGRQPAMAIAEPYRGASKSEPSRGFRGEITSSLAD